MGCGCVTQHQVGQSRIFLHSVTDSEFVKKLEPHERKDKKLLLAYFHLEQEGQFLDTDKLRNLVRSQGVPTRYRWRVWRAITGWASLCRPGAYERILQRQPDRKTVEAIEKDIDRTFPNIEEFDDGKKRQLANMLQALACLFPQVGYCQGMNFVAGFALLASAGSPELARGCSSQEDSCFLLIQIMGKYRASLLFCDGLPLLKLRTFQFKELLRQLFPDVHRHFEANSITPELYLTKWIITVFTQPLPFTCTARVWDLIVCDGLQAVVPIALATIKLMKSRLLREGTEGILELLTFRADGPLPSGAAIVEAALGILPKIPASLNADGKELFEAWERVCPQEAADFRRAEQELCNGPYEVQNAATEAPGEALPEVELPAVASERAPIHHSFDQAADTNSDCVAADAEERVNMETAPKQGTPTVTTRPAAMTIYASSRPAGHVRSNSRDLSSSKSLGQRSRIQVNGSPQARQPDCETNEGALFSSLPPADGSPHEREDRGMKAKGHGAPGAGLVMHKSWELRKFPEEVGCGIELGDRGENRGITLQAEVPSASTCGASADTSRCSSADPSLSIGRSPRHSTELEGRRARSLSPRNLARSLSPADGLHPNRSTGQRTVQRESSRSYSQREMNSLGAEDQLQDEEIERFVDTDERISGSGQVSSPVGMTRSLLSPARMKEAWGTPNIEDATPGPSARPSTCPADILAYALSEEYAAVLSPHSAYVHALGAAKSIQESVELSADASEEEASVVSFIPIAT